MECDIKDVFCIKEKLPRCLEWVTFVETLPDYFKYEFYKPVDDKEIVAGYREAI